MREVVLEDVDLDLVDLAGIKVNMRRIKKFELTRTYKSQMLVW